MLLQQRNRRVFLADVARGMLVAGVGLGTALDLGLTKTRAEEAAKPRLSFGALDPLVGMMQQTPAASLVPQLVDALKNGTSLRDLLTAGALANARSFGGGDYIGYHTLMALGPAWLMSQEAPAAEQALPVFKVLYRNTARIQDSRAFEHEALQPVVADRSAGTVTGEMLRDAVRQHDMARAEAQFATLADQSPQAAFNELLYAVQDETEVHRVALPYRAYALIDLIGAEHAQTLLRQSLRYCVNAENWNRKSTYGDVRVLLPKLFDQHRLAGRTAGDKPAEDAWIEQFVQLLFTSTPEQAAEATAAALAEGMLPEAVGEAISLAANQLVLRDQGRTGEIEQRGKPIGSVHGDSIGVHASDSANARKSGQR